MPESLAAHPEHGGITDADLEAFLAGTPFQSTPAEPSAGTITPPAVVDLPVDDGAPASGDGLGTSGEPVPTGEIVEPPAVDDPNRWTFDDGSEITREQAQALANFDTWLASNPELAQKIVGISQGLLDVVPAGTPQIGLPSPVPTPVAPATAPAPAAAFPEEFDADDPIQRRLWSELQSTRGQLDAAGEILTRHEQLIQQQNMTTANSMIASAAHTFQERRSLSDEDTRRVVDVAGRLGVLSSLTQVVDPLTGLPRQVDPLAALDQAYELAYWQVPEFRTRELEALTKQRMDDEVRRAKATSVSGTTASTPRVPATPKTAHEMREAMTADVARFMAGESID